MAADPARARAAGTARPPADEPALRTVNLLRHAKSSWEEPALADRERPLAARGQRDAKAMARHLASRPQPLAPLVLCSPARRTLETLELLRSVLGPAAMVQIESGLYLAGAGRLLERLRRLPDERHDVLVIGHDPGLHDLALALTRAEDSRGYRRLREKLPTGTLVELEFRLPHWRDLEGGTARLAAFTRPRDLQ